MVWAVNSSSKYLVSVSDVTWGLKGGTSWGRDVRRTQGGKIRLDNDTNHWCSKLQSCCLKDIRICMSQNFLQLNRKKNTEAARLS